MSEQLRPDEALPFPGTLRDRWHAQVVVPVNRGADVLCSGTALAIATCASGVVGTMTLNHRRAVDQLDLQVAKVHDDLGLVRDARPGHLMGPLAVNTALGLNECTVARLLETCRRRSDEVVITANRDPRSFVPTLDAARGGLHAARGGGLTVLTGSVTTGCRRSRAGVGR